MTQVEFVVPTTQCLHMLFKQCSPWRTVETLCLGLCLGLCGRTCQQAQRKKNSSKHRP